jgi:hypothetical protein
MAAWMRSSASLSDTINGYAPGTGANPAGGRPTLGVDMSSRPGAGCNDPRDPHAHWCGFCGAEQWFGTAECRNLLLVPPCLRCGERDWRDDIDELTAPDHREQ